MQEISKHQLMTVFKYYQNEINSRFYGMLMTEATIYRVESFLRELQTNMQRRENNPVWRVPVKIIADRALHNITLEPVLFDFVLKD